MKRDIIYGLIISAGLSGRMNDFKPLLHYGGKSFLTGIFEKLSSVCSKIIVVTGSKSDLIVKELKENLNRSDFNKLTAVFNPNYKTGMFTSLQTGLKKCIEANWVIYHFIDQPNLPAEFYTDFISERNDKYNWIQPINKGRKGHPILLSKKCFPLILNASANSSLRNISRKITPKKYWDCHYTQIFTDIDTREDYLKIK